MSENLSARIFSAFLDLVSVDDIEESRLTDIEGGFFDVLLSASDGISFLMVIFSFKHSGLMFVKDDDMLMFDLSKEGVF